MPCTDITGFGLLGHLKSMAAASKVDVELAMDELPLLPGVVDLRGRRDSARRGGTQPQIVGRRAPATVEGVDAEWLDILFDSADLRRLADLAAGRCRPNRWCGGCERKESWNSPRLSAASWRKATRTD